MRRMNCGSKRREECSEECADGKLSWWWYGSWGVFFFNVFFKGNTEEELEEYTEIFENIEEYRGDSKHNKPIDDDDDDEDDDDDDEDDDDDDDDDDEEEEEEEDEKPKKKQAAKSNSKNNNNKKSNKGKKSEL
jgi:hypothetical protein